MTKPINILAGIVLALGFIIFIALYRFHDMVERTWTRYGWWLIAGIVLSITGILLAQFTASPWQLSGALMIAVAMLVIPLGLGRAGPGE